MCVTLVLVFHECLPTSWLENELMKCSAKGDKIWEQQGQGSDREEEDECEQEVQ